MRAEANLCWHVMTDVWRLEPSAKKRVALCGRSIPSRWTAEVIDDGTVPEPVCATCVRAARARS
jgi:hypothetical protein